MWIHPSTIRNYMLDNALESYLQVHRTPSRSNTRTRRPDTFTQYIMDKGHDFEDRVIQLLEQRLPNSNDLYKFQSPHLNSSFTINDRIEETAKLLKAGQPIIYQGALEHPTYGIRGLPDLIVRGSHLRYFSDEPIKEKIHSKHYYIVDIKFSTLHLSPKGHVYNAGSVVAYKGQVALYTLCLYHTLFFITPYNPKINDTSIAFLLGRRILVGTTGRPLGDYGQCFERLGPVFLQTTDKPSADKALEAVKWYREMVTHGSSWSIDPPNPAEHPELFPNLSVSASGKWSKYIRDLATRNGDVSLVWNIGPRRREAALDHGIISWRDPRLTPELVGVSGKIAKVMGHILETNRSQHKVLPRPIMDNYMSWQDTSPNTLDFYIDFEVTTSAFDNLSELPLAKDESFIFAVGVGHVVNNHWTYAGLVANELSCNSEYELIDSFIQYIRRICRENGIDPLVSPPRLFHWGSAEFKWISRTLTRANSTLSRRECRYWNRIFSGLTNMVEILQDVPVAVNGALNYKLKHFTKALEGHGMRSYMVENVKDSPYRGLQSLWPSTPSPDQISDGVDAMYYCWSVYQDPTLSADDIQHQLQKVIEYNALDCFSVCSIRLFLIHKYGRLGYSTIDHILSVMDSESDSEGESSIYGPVHTAFTDDGSTSDSSSSETDLPE